MVMMIRDARLEELPLIREQRVRSYEEHSKSIPEGHWNALKQAILSEGDQLPEVDRIVAEINGEIVGSVVLFPAKTDAYEGAVDQLDYPENRMLAVVPEARGKGAAAALVSECIKRAKLKGHQSIGLHTADYMENAVKLYTSFGFQRLPEFDFQPLDDGITVKAYLLTIE
jgi:GNAT superfamily N-acetyltransferase